MTLRATLRWTGWDLLGHVDDAHASFADLLQQLVGAHHRPRRRFQGSIRFALRAVRHGSRRLSVGRNGMKLPVRWCSREQRCSTRAATGTSPAQASARKSARSGGIFPELRKTGP